MIREKLLINKKKSINHLKKKKIVIRLIKIIIVFNSILIEGNKNMKILESIEKISFVCYIE